MSATDSSTPAGLVDLAAARIGGLAFVANDEFFAEKQNLLHPGRGVFIPNKYTDHGNGWTAGKPAAVAPQATIGVSCS